MKTLLLPYAYSLLVFAIVAFLFVLLGRIFLNVETIVYYDFDRLAKINDKTQEYDDNFVKCLQERGRKGWKLDRIDEIKNFGNGSVLILLVFTKSKNKINLF